MMARALLDLSDAPEWVVTAVARCEWQRHLWEAKRRGGSRPADASFEHFKPQPTGVLTMSRRRTDPAVMAKAMVATYKSVDVAIDNATRWAEHARQGANDHGKFWFSVVDILKNMRTEEAAA